MSVAQCGTRTLAKTTTFFTLILYPPAQDKDGQSQSLNCAIDTGISGVSR